MEELNKKNNSINTFELLNNINVSSKIEEKIGLKYLSWANAWAYLKSNCPDAFYTIYTRQVSTVEEVTTKDEMTGAVKVTKTESVNEVPYFTDGKTCYVQVGVTINDVEYVEYLPVMDNRNNAIMLPAITMTAVNKAIQRAFVKACARHGLGLYVYAGEDLPETEKKAFNEATTSLRKSIDDIAQKIENSAFESNIDITSLAVTVTNQLQDLPANLAAYAQEYIKEQIAAYKINKVSENAIALQKVAAFIKEVSHLA